MQVKSMTAQTLLTAEFDCTPVESVCAVVQIKFDDFKEFASLRKELHKLQVALEFYQKTTGGFGLADLKAS